MKDLTIKFLKNSYVIIIIIFVIWMIFFDSNSILVQNELNNDINDLNNQKEYYKNEIERDNIELNQIKTDSGLEKYAREKLFMKRDNEEIFIIEVPYNEEKIDSYVKIKIRTENENNSKNKVKGDTVVFYTGGNITIIVKNMEKCNLIYEWIDKLITKNYNTILMDTDTEEE